MRHTAGRSRAVLIMLLGSLLTLTACTAAPSPRTFSFSDVEDDTSSTLYSVGPTAHGVSSETDNTVSIDLTSKAGPSVLVYPTVAIYFADTTVHCYADGTGPSDSVTLSETTESRRFICEEPFPDLPSITRIIVTDTGGKLPE